MVTKVTNLTTKDGKPYGRFVLEDYSGEYEFTLWSKEYEQFRPYLFENYCLLIRGMVRERTYRPGEMEVRLMSMGQLAQMQEDIIKQLIVNIYLEELDGELIKELTKRVKQSKGGTPLRIRITDSKSDVAVDLRPKKLKVKVDHQLLDWLEEKGIPFSIVK